MLGKTHHPAYAGLCDPMRRVTFFLVGWMMGKNNAKDRG
jgi:hypothetical protein